MPKGKPLQISSHSNKIEPCVTVDSSCSNRLINSTVTEKAKNNIVTKGVDHQTVPTMHQQYRTASDFAPWFNLDCVKQSLPGGSINSDAKLQKGMTTPKKKNVMLSKGYSFDEIIILESEEEDSSEEGTEDEKIELRKRMLGFFN